MSKHCNNKECNVELIVGENITQGMFNNRDYKCKPCVNERVYSWARRNPIAKAKISKRSYYNNIEYYRQNYRDNIDQRKTNMAQHYQDNKEVYSIRMKEKNKIINPGVYGIYDGDKLIYIGESAKPYRRRGEHFSIAGKQGGTNAKSVISRALGNGELQIDKLQQRYKPIYN